MPGERNKYILTGLVILLLAAGYYLLKGSSGEWSLNLDKSGKNAYGTFITYELLKQKYSRYGFAEIRKPLPETLKKLDSNKTYNYIFIHNIPYYDSASTAALYRFAENGNTVFISCEGFHYLFLDSIINKSYHLKVTSGYNEVYYKLYDSVSEIKRYSTFNFIHPTLKDSNGYIYYLKNKADTIINHYNTFRALPDSECVYPIPDINSISFAGLEESYDSGLNLAILKHGKGQIVILLSAIPFTNYFMRTQKGLEYAEKVFSHLPDQTTLWDDVSHEYKFDTGNQYRGNSNFGDSPLYFILKHATLRWAWYLTILGVIIYGFFHAKRRQNIIPVIPPKENTSLKYVETIGQLYFNAEEHLEIALEMRLQLLNHIRQKYFLKTNETDESFYNLLAQKSSVSIESVQSIFNTFNRIRTEKKISSRQLQQLNAELEYFYKNCK
ncbi:MAG: hypothetical protein IPM95_01520 [Sphingobacteriales bacterium]|nr:hypothetical protein [Sphingobacteriales bacterium]